jgi:hypothetical protein
VRGLGEGQDLGRLDPEHACHVVLRTEAAFDDVEVPGAAVLGLVGVREALQRVVVGDADRFALDDDVEPLGPGPSWKTPTSGVTCGRPSARTVVIQYSSARSSACSVSDHGVGWASGSLKRVSSCMRLTTGRRARIHRGTR